MTQPRQPYSPPPARRRSPIPWIVLAVALVAAGVVLVPRLANDDDDGAEPVAAAEQDPMLLAGQNCDPGKKGVKLSDGNRKLTVNRSGLQDKSGVGADELSCVLETLQVPGALSDRMLDTTGADGQLQGDWPGFTVTWTNSTAKGLDVTVTRD